MRDNKKDYKRMWFTYKQRLLDEFENICKEVITREEEIEELNKMPISATQMAVRKDNSLVNIKLQGQSLVNILMIIDRIGNTPTVATMSAVYEKAFEILEVVGYDYYNLPFDEFLAELKSYKDRWRELEDALMSIIRNMEQHVLKNEEALKYAHEQLITMNEIEERFGNEIQM
ncbi:hypothetical protein [Staphylococcus pettenkoferi]|uniref:hypothetical protein n=1 Tax=Staphylococcus pettenkoferi TaxID=170573 RepID=UPI00255417BB|nr:hypothetical protein [Staphylococcus pettenkoferi]MDK7284474.1 hypothetical protein [Staphylococcus pettenkoferi]